MKVQVGALLLLLGRQSATAQRSGGVRSRDAGNSLEKEGTNHPARSRRLADMGCAQGEGEGLLDNKCGYEVWGSDQSNSVPGQTGAGKAGSFIWIWDHKDIEAQLAGGPPAPPLPCGTLPGPCDLNGIFPPDLIQVMTDGTPTGKTLADLSGFGRLHGMLVDPMGRYVAASIFFPTGGFVGVIDTKTREAIALFRVTETTGAGPGRSVHMNFWSEDGSKILVTNLHGKMIERIDVVRNAEGEIEDLQYNLSAGVYLGKAWSPDNPLEAATVFTGQNHLGNDLIGTIVGIYDDADTGDLTPAGACKESGCANPSVAMLGGTRGNNVPICPIPSPEGNVYVTLGGGGLFVLKSDETPMEIVGEYGNAVINGAGCGGAAANGSMFLNAGVSASGAGVTQSTFTVYALPDAEFEGSAKQNHPFPIQAFKDKTNTKTIGNVDSVDEVNETGQLPHMTTRRDSHGTSATLDEKYVHVSDRIQNVIEVFDSVTFERVNTYDLVSASGKGGREGVAGACLAVSVLDDADLPLNDPAADLVSEPSPDGKYFFVAFRGPVPVTVNHAAQGSCPGAGIVEITEGGASGKLVGVLRSTNEVDTVPVGPPNTPDTTTVPGGILYAGAERSDIHHVAVILKQ